MDLNCIFEALEDISQRMYSGRKSETYENLTEIINNIKANCIYTNEKLLF